MAADWERGLNLEGSFVKGVEGLMGNADVNQDGETTVHELVDFLQVKSTPYGASVIKKRPHGLRACLGL